jgi:hypothetical protein
VQAVGQALDRERRGQLVHPAGQVGVRDEDARRQVERQHQRLDRRLSGVGRADRRGQRVRQAAERRQYAVIGAAAFQVDDIHVTVEAIEA